MLEKLCHRLSDPVFYRKRFRNLVRPFKRIPASPGFDLGQLPDEARGALVVAHPDDELFCSGLLCECADRGIRIEVLCLTRGEGGPTGDHSREALGAIRETEMGASCNALGVRNLRFLDYLDPLGKKFRTYAPDVSRSELASRLAGVFDEIQPHLVVTHGSGGEYWHPAHLLAHAAVLDAMKSRASSQPAPVLLTMNAWQANHPIATFLNRDDPAHLSIEASRYREQRLQAFESHKSQLDFFAGHAGGSYEAFLDWMNPENYRVWRDF